MGKQPWPLSTLHFPGIPQAGFDLLLPCTHCSGPERPEQSLIPCQYKPLDKIFILISLSNYYMLLISISLEIMLIAIGSIITYADCYYTQHTYFLRLIIRASCLATANGYVSSVPLLVKGRITKPSVFLHSRILQEYFLSIESWHVAPNISTISRHAFLNLLTHHLNLRAARRHPSL